MPVDVRIRHKGEGGKLWKIVEPSGRVVGESDTKKKADAAKRLRNDALRRRGL